MKTYKNVDEYIKKADKDKQKILSEIRQLVKDNFKQAKEGIAYGMPAYNWEGQPLLYFAAMKGHIGIYPTPGPILALQKELKGLSVSKGCVRFLYGKTISKNLILKLLKERAKEIKLKNKLDKNNKYINKK